MKEKAVEIMGKKNVTIVVNGDEYRISGWPISKTVFTLDIMNISKINKYGCSYPEAVNSGFVFEYTVENNVKCIEKALCLLCEGLL